MNTEHYLSLGTIFVAGADSVKLNCQLSMNFTAQSAVNVWVILSFKDETQKSKTLPLKCCLRVGSHDPITDPITFLSLFHLIEILIGITNYFELLITLN